MTLCCSPNSFAGKTQVGGGLLETALKFFHAAGAYGSPGGTIPDDSLPKFFDLYSIGKAITRGGFGQRCESRTFGNTVACFAAGCRAVEGEAGHENRWPAPLGN